MKRAGHSRVLRIADIAICFRGSKDACALLDGRFAPFVVTSANADAEIDLDLYPVPVEAWACPELDVAENEGALILSATGIDASISADSRSARLRAPCAPESIDAILRVLLSEHLLVRGGVLLHGCAMLHGERAYLFAGESGAGKSTLAAELGWPCMCDEAVALVPKGDSVLAFSTPYWKAEPHAAPVAGLYFLDRQRRLREGKTLQRECAPLPMARAAARLVSCVGPLRPSAHDKLFEIAATLVQTLPPSWSLNLSTRGDIQSWLRPTLERQAAPCGESPPPSGGESPPPSCGESPPPSCGESRRPSCGDS